MLAICVRLKLHFISATLQNIYLLSWFVEYLPNHKEELATDGDDDDDDDDDEPWKSLRADDAALRRTRKRTTETETETETVDCIWTCVASFLASLGGKWVVGWGVGLGWEWKRDILTGTGSFLFLGGIRAAASASANELRAEVAAIMR